MGIRRLADILQGRFWWDYAWYSRTLIGCLETSWDKWHWLSEIHGTYMRQADATSAHGAVSLTIPSMTKPCNTRGTLGLQSTRKTRYPEELLTQTRDTDAFIHPDPGEQ